MASTITSFLHINRTIRKSLLPDAAMTTETNIGYIDIDDP